MREGQVDAEGDTKGLGETKDSWRDRGMEGRRETEKEKEIEEEESEDK